MDFKVKCVSVHGKENYFTEGEVYEVNNGVIVSDEGYKYDAWSYPDITEERGNDIESLNKWFANWYRFEVVEDAKVFTKNDLKTGMFGVMDDEMNFVIVGDKIIYQNDGFDNVKSLTEDLCFYSRKIMKVYDGCYSFRHLNDLINNIAYTPATLVYDRERDTEKFYNGKVVCIDNTGNSRVHTVGKIYQFEDGCITVDDGYKYDKFHTFEEWAKFSHSKWLEIKE